MFQARRISKNYGSKEVLREISFTLNRGDRAALLGPNGCGKTTLLRIIAGEESPDSGDIDLDQRAVLGYLPQGFDLALDQTIADTVYDGIPGYLAAKEQLEDLLATLEKAGEKDLDSLLQRYDAAFTTFQALGGYEIDDRASLILAHLGLDSDLATPLVELSGGQRTRVGLARVLLAQPDLLMLDEPTNHLDLDALDWLENFLTSYQGALLLVSHDRAFLNRIANQIIAIDPETHQAEVLIGTYDDYLHAREIERAKQWGRWTDQVAEDRRMKIAINRLKERSERFEHMSKEDFYRRKAKLVMRKAMAQKSRLERDMASTDRVEKPREGWTLALDFGEMPRGGQEVIRLKHLGHAYPGGEYLFRDTTLTLHHGERIALLGANGSGKTTLFRIIMGALAPTEGEVERGANIHIGYMPQGQAGLPLEKVPLEIIRHAAPLDETQARRFLHRFLFTGDEVFTRVADLSFGQRARLILAEVVLGGANCLLLDEPVNHLDIPSRENFAEALDDFPGPVLFTIHDRALIDQFATGIWLIESGLITPYPDRIMMEKRYERRNRVP